MMNLSIGGNVGKDAEVRAAGSSQVCNFSVAVSGYDRRAKSKTTTWIRVAVWGARAEQLATLITKGSKVAVSGTLEVGEYQGKPQLTLTAQDVTLLGKGQESAPSPSKGKPAAATGSSDDEPGDDDLPF